jgi:signal transduction histidine kinase
MSKFDAYRGSPASTVGHTLAGRILTRDGLMIIADEATIGSMSATPNAGWTELLAAALAHDINNLALSLSSAQRLTRQGAGEDFEAGEWAAFVEADVDRLRKLGVRLRALAAAGDPRSSALLDDACGDALAAFDPAGGQARLTDSPTLDARVRGPAAAVTAAITSLLEHARAASPTGAPIELAVRDASGGSVIVEIATRAASATAEIGRARLDTLLDTALRDRRGDFSLVLAGAVADALGGAVYFASDSQRGLVLELQLRI